VVLYLSEQNKIELLGVMICFSQTVLHVVSIINYIVGRCAYQKFKKLTAIESSSSQKSLSASLWWGTLLLPLLPWECDRFDRGAGLGRACAGSDLFE
jgi:hypothetical protein